MSSCLLSILKSRLPRRPENATKPNGTYPTVNQKPRWPLLLVTVSVSQIWPIPSHSKHINPSLIMRLLLPLAWGDPCQWGKGGFQKMGDGCDLRDIYGPPGPECCLGVLWKVKVLPFRTLQKPGPKTPTEVAGSFRPIVLSTGKVVVS